jgi:hypothetical protein
MSGSLHNFRGRKIMLKAEMRSCSAKKEIR